MLSATARNVCRYGTACYRKNPGHLNQFHSTSPPAMATPQSPVGDCDAAIAIPDTFPAGSLPQRTLKDGEVVEVPSSTSETIYKCKRAGPVYYCTCPAWRNQRIHPRTCKHLKELLGEQFEMQRCGTSKSAVRWIFPRRFHGKEERALNVCDG